MVVKWSFLHHFEHDLYLIMVVKWSFLYFIMFVQETFSPWYNRTGWLGVKHQFTYLLTGVIPSSLQHDLSFIMIVPWSFLHHYSTTCTLLWSYSGHFFIIPARFTTNWPRQRCQWWLVYTCLTEVCSTLRTKAKTKTTANGPKEETKSETTLTASALKQDPRFKTTNILIKHVVICTMCIKHVVICTMCIKHVDICTMCIKHVVICTMCIKHVDILETKPFFQATDWQLNDD